MPGPDGNSGGQRLFACLYGGSVHGDPYGNIGNGFWLTGLPVFSQLSGRRVWMAGVFTQHDRGHLEQWPGTMCVTSAGLVT